MTHLDRGLSSSRLELGAARALAGATEPQFPTMPESPVLRALQEVHETYRNARDGSVATYIPELGRVAPDQFGIALVMTDGHAYTVGDAQAPFTIQSISKPLVYGLALHDRGRDAVLARIGVEPSGDPFNTILFGDVRDRPYNPMLNAGAIVATSLIRGRDTTERLGRILGLFRALSGRSLGIDDAVYRSESATGHRNRGLAYLSLSNGIIEGDVDAHLDLYFRQCAILTTATDLAWIAATLANGGAHPLTGERALPAEHIRDVLSVMTTCGMYDYAGEWELRIGLPAKSGVGGGLMAVLPGQLGIGIFSPRLDEHGNSFRGIRVCETLSERLQLHLLAHRGRARSAIRRSYDRSEVSAKRVRSKPATALLDSLGAAIRVFELQGDLSFANTEQAIRAILQMPEVCHLILDLSRVTSIDAVAADLLRTFYWGIAASMRTIALAAVSGEMTERLAIDRSAFATSVETALEACEDVVLWAAAGEQAAAARAELGNFELLSDLTAEERKLLNAYLVPRCYATGETIIEESTVADGLYFLLEGCVDVCVVGAGSGQVTRLASVEAGNVFGELALLGAGRRTASVVAATPVDLLELTSDDFGVIARSHPSLHAKLLIGVGRSLSERLRRANAMIRSLGR